MPTGDPDKDKNLPGIDGAFNSSNLNLYVYTHQNPVKYIDPNGLSVEEVKSIDIEIARFLPLPSRAQIKPSVEDSPYVHFASVETLAGSALYYNMRVINKSGSHMIKSNAELTQQVWAGSLLLVVKIDKKTGKIIGYALFFWDNTGKGKWVRVTNEKNSRTMLDSGEGQVVIKKVVKKINKWKKKNKKRIEKNKKRIEKNKRKKNNTENNDKKGNKDHDVGWSKKK